MGANKGEVNEAFIAEWLNQESLWDVMFVGCEGQSI